jgi:transcriptional regulator with XRE-family HTH domain
MSAVDGSRLGERLRARRRTLGLTQEALAEKVGIAPQFLGRIERGVALPSVPTLFRLTEVLGLGVDELLSREEAPVPPTPGPLESFFFDLAVNGPPLRADVHQEGATVGGLVTKAVRERLRAGADSADRELRQRLCGLIESASHRTLAIITPVLEALALADEVRARDSAKHSRRA